jgi:hypothetical protein
VVDTKSKLRAAGMLGCGERGRGLLVEHLNAALELGTLSVFLERHNLAVGGDNGTVCRQVCLKPKARHMQAAVANVTLCPAFCAQLDVHNAAISFHACAVRCRSRPKNVSTQLQCCMLQAHHKQHLLMAASRCQVLTIDV